MYPFKEIEKKWQSIWDKQHTFQACEAGDKKKIYCLEMFPYPSGSGLHVGHLKNYVPMDAYCRFKSMQGFNVLHPMGWDAFGQPAENEAIRCGRNPREMVPDYAARYKQTLIKVGCSYDWKREINSSDPEYYHWTQWFFLLLYRRGLAYRATAPINWCPSCKTGLANEEVREGCCWRCDSLVEKKPMPQWFFRITEYADRLLKDLDSLDWTDGMKEMQRDWIGRSEGAEVEFAVEGTDRVLRVFTTRPDTLFGATFMVLAPEHPLVRELTEPERREQVERYIHQVQSETEIDRLTVDRSKTGEFTGAFAVNPVNKKRIPIWIADYVMMGYGTGAIMAVPGHDARDFAFARKFDLPIIQVVSRTGEEYSLQEAEPADGIAINSGSFTGLTTAQFKKAITDWLKENQVGKPTVNFRLRDWLISRQRYWGAPIPIIHCDRCGTVPVPEEELPVLLPEVADYQPSGTGESPLAAFDFFVQAQCPKCKGLARRETDTMGGYACSSWYYFRYVDPKNSHMFASRKALDFWLPVDIYTGGIEHARSHLLYSRFLTKVLYDEGVVNFSEPFLLLRNQGSMLAYTAGRKPRTCKAGGHSEADDKIIDWIVLKPEEKDQFPPNEIVWRWARMSKSKGNVVTPDEIAGRFGADSLRIYIMFVAPFEENVQWTEEGIQGSFRFVSRIWRWLQAALPLYQNNWSSNTPTIASPQERSVRRKLHQTLHKVELDFDHFQFNTAVAAIMELLNEVTTYAPVEKDSLPELINPILISEIIEMITLLLAPFAPHLCEEIWERLNKPGSIYKAPWPKFDPIIAAKDEITIVVQINGKIRDKLLVPVGLDEPEVRKLALSSTKVIPHIESKKIVKILYIKDRMLSVVVK